MKKSGVNALMRHQVCYFEAISNRDMSSFVGISPQFSCIFSLISRVFINFNEKVNSIICTLDHLVNMLCLRLGAWDGLRYFIVTLPEPSINYYAMSKHSFKSRLVTQRHLARVRYESFCK